MDRIIHSSRIILSAKRFYCLVRLLSQPFISIYNFNDMKFFSLLPKVSAVVLLMSSLSAFADEEFPKIDPKNVTIVRDSFGIRFFTGCPYSAVF